MQDGHHRTVSCLYWHQIACIINSSLLITGICPLILSETKYGAITHGVETNAFMFSGYTCQVAQMSQLKIFISKFNLFNLKVHDKPLVHPQICCLNRDCVVFFVLELGCHILSVRDVFLEHGLFSWITQSSMFNTVKYALCNFKFVTISLLCLIA